MGVVVLLNMTLVTGFKEKLESNSDYLSRFVRSLPVVFIILSISDGFILAGFELGEFLCRKLMLFFQHKGTIFMFILTSLHK